VDHGAQFFTVRDEQFERVVAGWIADDLVVEWTRGFEREDGHPRYVVRGGMNALAKHLARGVDVRCPSLVFSVHRRRADGPGPAWDVTLDDGTVHGADAVVVTCPLAQSYSLLATAEMQVPETLWRTDYDRTLALLAVLDRPSAVPAPGGVQTDPSFTFIGDNAAKGVSAVPAVTFHANPAWSHEHWDHDPAVVADELVELARPWFGDAVLVDHQVKRWRFATPRSIWPDRCWTPDDGSRVAVAGDAFAGPRVEGAALSGLAAADAVR
jgi:renalase